MKKYSLTNEEKSNLAFRKSVLDYLTSIVQQDTAMFVELNIKKRLSLGNDDVIEEVDFKTGEIQVTNSKTDIAVPSNEETASVLRTSKRSK